MPARMLCLHPKPTDDSLFCAQPRPQELGCISNPQRAEPVQAVTPLEVAVPGGCHCW